MAATRSAAGLRAPAFSEPSNGARKGVGVMKGGETVKGVR
jgi:hypothetical protein